MISRSVERSKTYGSGSSAEAFPDRESSIVLRDDSLRKHPLMRWSPGVSLRSTARLSSDFSLREKSRQLSVRSCRGAWKGARVAREDAGELPLNVTNLRILP